MSDETRRQLFGRSRTSQTTIGSAHAVAAGCRSQHDAAAGRDDTAGPVECLGERLGLERRGTPARRGRAKIAATVAPHRRSISRSMSTHPSPRPTARAAAPSSTCRFPTGRRARRVPVPAGRRRSNDVDVEVADELRRSAERSGNVGQSRASRTMVTRLFALDAPAQWRHDGSSCSCGTAPRRRSGPRSSGRRPSRPGTPRPSVPSTSIPSAVRVAVHRLRFLVWPG